jgi:hypothetical protein
LAHDWQDTVAAVLHAGPPLPNYEDLWRRLHPEVTTQ